jgi:UTP--glucose-1-phosphate uridylyltransferase
MDLPLIVNRKEYLGKDVIQLETAMGAAIGLFENTSAFVVPRKRFAPVKTCADLLVRRSDAYILEEKSGLLLQNPLKDYGEIFVTLDDNYNKLENFDRYFSKIPSLLHARSLLLKGPVQFDIPVNIFGDVVIENPGNTVRKISEVGKIKFENENFIF